VRKMASFVSFDRGCSWVLACPVSVGVARHDVVFWAGNLG
jgi:hypothetical protein